MVLNIYFWRGAIAQENGFLTQFQPIVKKLLTNDYNPNDLEQLRGHRGIYSYRINQVERLLFSTWKKNGQSYLLLLEHLPTHDYQKSRFLQSGVLKRFLIRHAEAFHESSQEVCFQPLLTTLFDASATSETIDEISIQPMDYHHEFIQLNIDQEHALSVSLPSLITGSAGSGKSCIAMLLLATRLEQFRLNHSDINPLRMLYITKSESLIHQMRLIWADQPVLQGLERETVEIDFCTPEQLITQHTNMLGMRFTTDEDWSSWFDAKYAQYKKTRKTATKHALSCLDTPDKLLEEFRICSGYSSSKYSKLGARQSSVSRDLRESVLELYIQYLNDREQLGLIDPSFNTASCGRNKYHLIVVDEAQNFSHVQLHDLAELAIDKAIVYCMDSHQYLDDKISKRSFLVDELFRRVGASPHLTEIQLNVGYRCPLSISQLANVVLDLKHQVQGGLLDQHTTQAVSTAIEDARHIGSVYLIHPGQNTPAWILEQARGTQLVVLTSEEVLAEPGSRNKIEQLFQTPNIMTVNQCQGQQYTTVIAYRLLNEKNMKALKDPLSALLTSADSAGVRTYHRPKADTGSDASTLFLNHLYTSYTRALEHVVIYEMPIPCNQPFFKLIKPYVTLSSIAPISEISSNEEHWLEAARLQLTLGNKSLAQQICAKKTSYSWYRLQQEHQQRCIQSGISIDEPISTELDSGVKDMAVSEVTEAVCISNTPPHCKPTEEKISKSGMLDISSLVTTEQKNNSSTRRKKSKYLLNFFETPMTRERFDDFLNEVNMPFKDWLFYSLKDKQLVINKIAENPSYTNIFLSSLVETWIIGNKMANSASMIGGSNGNWLNLRTFLTTMATDFDPFTLMQNAFIDKKTQCEKMFSNESNDLYLFLFLVVISTFKSKQEIKKDPPYSIMLVKRHYMYWLAAFAPELLAELFNRQFLDKFISSWNEVPHSLDNNIIQVLSLHEQGRLLLQRLTHKPLFSTELTKHPEIIDAISTALSLPENTSYSRSGYRGLFFNPATAASEASELPLLGEGDEIAVRPEETL